MTCPHCGFAYRYAPHKACPKCKRPVSSESDSLVQILKDGEPIGRPVTHLVGVSYIEAEPRRDWERYDLVYVETGRLASYVLR